jgi:hypothetical protein
MVEPRELSRAEAPPAVGTEAFGDLTAIVDLHPEGFDFALLSGSVSESPLMRVR